MRLEGVLPSRRHGYDNGYESFLVSHSPPGALACVLNAAQAGARKTSLSAVDPFRVPGKPACRLPVSGHGSGSGVSTIVPSTGHPGIVDSHCFFVESYENECD